MNIYRNTRKVDLITYDSNIETMMYYLQRLYQIV